MCAASFSGDRTPAASTEKLGSTLLLSPDISPIDSLVAWRHRVAGNLQLLSSMVQPYVASQDIVGRPQLQAEEGTLAFPLLTPRGRAVGSCQVKDAGGTDVYSVTTHINAKTFSFVGLTLHDAFLITCGIMRGFGCAQGIPARNVSIAPAFDTKTEAHVRVPSMIDGFKSDIAQFTSAIGVSLTSESSMIRGNENGRSVDEAAGMHDQAIFINQLTVSATILTRGYFGTRWGACARNEDLLKVTFPRSYDNGAVYGEPEVKVEFCADKTHTRMITSTWSQAALYARSLMVGFFS